MLPGRRRSFCPPPTPAPVSLSPSCPVPLQFVLKHEALAHLREVACFPNTLNPHEAESLALVGAMVDQVMDLHPGARWLHVGCDEVGALSPLPLPRSAAVPPNPVFSSPTSWLPLLNRTIVRVPKHKEGLVLLRALVLLTLTLPGPTQTCEPSRHGRRPLRSRGRGGAGGRRESQVHTGRASGACKFALVTFPTRSNAV